MSGAIGVDDIGHGVANVGRPRVDVYAALDDWRESECRHIAFR